MIDQVTYDEDVSGQSPRNFIPREPQVVSEITDELNNILVPNHPPFYPKDFSIESDDGNGGFSPMQLGVDFEFVLPWYGFERVTGQVLYGGVKLHRKPTTPMVYVTYRTFGGKFSANRRLVLENLANYVWGPRILQWDQISNVQETFPPVGHTQPFDEFKGFEAVERSLEKIATLMSDGRPISLLAQREILFIRESYDRLYTEVNNYRSEMAQIVSRLETLERFRVN